MNVPVEKTINIFHSNFKHNSNLDSDTIIVLITLLNTVLEQNYLCFNVNDYFQNYRPAMCSPYSSILVLIYIILFEVTHIS